MLKKYLSLLIVPALAACLGCSGESVEDQERFQSQSPAEVNISNIIRNMVTELKEASTAEGGAGLKNASQSIAEGFDSSFDATLLKPEDQEKAKKISALITEVNKALQGGAKPADVSDKIKQMEDLANQLPKDAASDAGSGSDSASS